MSLQTQDAGFIIFGQSVLRDTVSDFINELKTSTSGYHWIDLHMRDAGGRTLVAYRVDFQSEEDTTHKSFHEHILTLLKRRFGMDKEGKRPVGVDQWSMSNVLESLT